jgi:hypothetical protein
MSRSEKNLTAGQWQAIASLVASGDLREAAGVAGCSVRTIRRWREDADFSAELTEAERQALRVTARRLAGASEKASDALVKIVSNENIAPGVRVRAALGILDVAIRYAAHVDLEARISALESKHYDDI